MSLMPKHNWVVKQIYWSHVLGAGSSMFGRSVIFGGLAPTTFRTSSPLFTCVILAIVHAQGEDFSLRCIESEIKFQ